MLLESGKMGATLSGVLSVYERIIFLSILVGMRENHFNVVALQMDDRVEGSEVMFSFRRSSRPWRDRYFLPLRKI